MYELLGKVVQILRLAQYADSEAARAKLLALEAILTEESKTVGTVDRLHRDNQGTVAIPPRDGNAHTHRKIRHLDDSHPMNAPDPEEWDDHG